MFKSQESPGIFFGVFYFTEIINPFSLCLLNRHNNLKSDYTDILIIGAGPSGMMAAGYLLGKNISIKIVEKQKFPRFTIGESLIPRCMDNFEEAGFLEILKKYKFQKKIGARFVKGEKSAEFDFSKKFGEGWDWTWQVPRADFDKALSDHIESRGTRIEFETEVTSVSRKDGLWNINLENVNGNKESIQARFIIDASGNGRVLARQLGLLADPKFNNHSSIFTHITEKEKPDPETGQLVSFEILNTETWFWYIPFSNGTSSIGFVGPDFWFSKFSGSTSEKFRKMLAETKLYRDTFRNSRFNFEPVEVKNISKNVKQIYGEGYALTGNSAEFIDPIFSSGVAFATESGLKAAKLAYKELKGEAVNWKKDYEEYIRKGVNVFATYVKEWYSGKLQDIIFHSNQNEQIKKQICAVLAGYVWDSKNPFVRNHDKILDHVISLIDQDNFL